MPAPATPWLSGVLFDLARMRRDGSGRGLHVRLRVEHIHSRHRVLEVCDQYNVRLGLDVHMVRQMYISRDHADLRPIYLKIYQAVDCPGKPPGVDVENVRDFHQPAPKVRFPGMARKCMPCLSTTA